MTDVGRGNSRCFINVTSGGFGAEITATTPVEMKKRLGGAAYTLMGLIKVFNPQPYRGRLLVPGEEPVEGAMLVMAVGNNRLAGGGFEVAPKAKMDDGLLDHLQQVWGALTERAFKRVQESGEIELCFGLVGVHYFLSGKTPFEAMVERSFRRRVQKLGRRAPALRYSSQAARQ